MADDWTAFSVTKPSTTNYIDVKCQPFERVSHTAHVWTALNMVREGRIRPGLVYDQSKLNTERVAVVWLSPNVWQYGSRYGSVEFWFDLDEILEARKPYWVESIAYKIAAPRILISANAGHLNLEEYDPTRFDGPWARSDTHYRNGDVTLEFMFDEPLNISQVKAISFVKHHSDYCSVYPTQSANCPEIGTSANPARNAFIAGLVLENLHAVDHLIDPVKHLTEVLNSGHFDANTHSVEYRGHFTSPDDNCMPAIDAYLLGLRMYAKESKLRAIGMFDAKETFIEALRGRLSKHFSIEIEG